MSDKDESRELLVAENARLRRELEEMRDRVDQFPAAQAIAEGEIREALVSEVPEYLYCIDFDNGKTGATFHSPSCETVTGYTPLEYAENPTLWMEMIHKDDLGRVWNFITGLKDPLHCKSIEHRIFHKDGSVRHVVNMTTVFLDENGSTLRQTGFLVDITNRREADARNQIRFNENRRNSIIDDLTRLYNRRGFRELAEQQLRIADKIHQPVLLFYIDVDWFKQTNDTFGHYVGDELLINLAGILKLSFRESDMIGRIGGDEFVVLIMESSPDSKELLLERFKERIELNNRNASTVQVISVSVGVSRHTSLDSDSLVSLIDRADKDMYDKKRRKCRL